jgi:hypothetical protein
MSSAELKNPETSLSEALIQTANAISSHQVTLREILGRIGEQSMLLFCLFLAIPFVLPVAPPGMSTALGLLITLIGVGIAMNRVPWLPDKLLDRPIDSAHVLPALRKGADVCRRFEKIVRPRLLALTHGATLNRINGFGLLFLALVLMAPLPLVPFSNTAPAAAIILLALGMAERDGLVIIAGYLAGLVATTYVGVLLYLVYWAGLEATEAMTRLFGA